ncbi:MAG: ATP-dependent DNA ligase [Candidatus Micrarchaeota archaeon]
MQFSKVAKVWNEIEQIGSRIEMAGIFSKLLLEIKKDEIKPLIYLSQGILLPEFEGLELGIGERLAINAISLVSGHDKKEIDKEFKKLGDLGEVAKWACGKKRQMSLHSHELSLVVVYNSLVKLAKLEGRGSQESKIKTLAELLNSAKGDEAKYIVRFCMGKMRLGVAGPTMLDAITLLRVPIVKKTICGIGRVSDGHVFRIKVRKEEEKGDDANASLELKFECEERGVEKIGEGEVFLVYDKRRRVEGLKAGKIRQDKNDFELYETELKGFKKMVRKPAERAYNLCSDLGRVIELALFDYNEIENFKLNLFSPIRPALAERLPSGKEIIDKIGHCAVEGKYDGFRVQVHKSGKKIELYSRKLEKVTHAFPEIVEAVEELGAKKAIFEGEALAFNEKEGRYYSFQTTIQRKRKYGIEKMRKEFPLKLFAFDLMYLDGIDFTREPYEKRRAELENLVKGAKDIEPAELKFVKNDASLENFFKKCIDKGLEGVIAKDLSAPYVAGAREFAWIKLKKSYGEMADTLDVVVVGYYLGKGQRAEFNFGGLLAGVRNEDTGMLETVAKVGGGFTEEEMIDTGKMLKGIKMKEKPKELLSKLTPDFWVEPKLVVSVSADEISVSNIHTCGEAGGKGYALRFPRMIEIREDKSIEDITTSSEVEKMYKMQKGHKKKN